MIHLYFTIIETNRSHFILSPVTSQDHSSNQSHHCSNCSKKCTHLSLLPLIAPETTHQSLYRIPKHQLTDNNTYQKHDFVSLSLPKNGLLYLLFNLLFIPLLFFICTLLIVNYLDLPELLSHEISLLSMACMSTFFCWIAVKKHVQNTLYRKIKKVK